MGLLLFGVANALATYAAPYTHTDAHTYRHKRMHACMHACMLACMLERMCVCSVCWWVILRLQIMPVVFKLIGPFVLLRGCVGLCCFRVVFQVSGQRRRISRSASPFVPSGVGEAALHVEGGGGPGTHRGPTGPGGPRGPWEAVALLFLGPPCSRNNASGGAGAGRCRHLGRGDSTGGSCLQAAAAATASPSAAVARRCAGQQEAAAAQPGPTVS